MSSIPTYLIIPIDVNAAVERITKGHCDHHVCFGAFDLNYLV